MTDILIKISRILNLGVISEPPRQLSGGFLHRMYALTTDRGRYAVKLLNPHIMARPDAMENFRRAEAFEAQLERTALPILPALVFGGRKMQQVDGQYFYVFDWFGGHALLPDEISEAHCRTIAAALAQLHAVDPRDETCETAAPDFDWDFFIHRLSVRKPDLGALLESSRSLLYETQRRAREAIPRLPAVSAICHSDMDSKNVLWRGGEFRIIDLECLSRGNPGLELYETALCWSGIESGQADPKRFKAFIHAYSQAGGTLPPDLTVVHDANTGRLGWLEYNLRRALGMDCSADEIAVGESEVRKTIAQLECCEKIREMLH